MKSPHQRGSGPRTAATRPRRRGGLIGAALGLLAGLALPALAASAKESFELVPGVVVDPAGDALYSMLPGGGVEKISLSSGNRLWTTDGAAKPMAVGGGRLLAQVERPGVTGRLQVATLDAETGALVGELGVAVPHGTRTAVDDGMDRTLNVRARFDGGQPLLTWQHEKRYMKGVPPGPDDPLREVREAAYRLDLEGERMVPIEIAAWPPQKALLPATVQAWASANPTGAAPVRVGQVFTTTRTEGDPDSPSSRVFLLRWDATSGAALPELELFSGPRVVQMRSADDRHLLVSERRAPGEREEYEWSVFSLESGEQVGQLRQVWSYVPFFVHGTHLVMVEPPSRWRESGDAEWNVERRRLRAAVLGSGSTVWERPLRDTAYYGPFPP